MRGTADLYTSAINRAGTLLAGKTNVYDMIVPTSMGITAPDNVVATINTSDQKKAINYMYSGMGKSGVKTVSIYDTLKARRNEYIFFRTDHHWTALGAYYAYCDFIKATGGYAGRRLIALSFISSRIISVRSIPRAKSCRNWRQILIRCLLISRRKPTPCRSISR